MSTENKDTENTTKAPIQAGALTQILSQYRTDARLGHEQVSEALCLPVASIKALENEEFDKLPEPPYIRGYLRTYARLAEQDATEVIKIYDTLHGSSSSATTTYNYTLNKKTGDIKPPLLSAASIRLGLMLLLITAVALLTMQPNVNQWMHKTWDSFSSEQTANSGTSLPGNDLTNASALAGDIPGNLPVSDEPDAKNIAQNTETTASSIPQGNTNPENTEDTETSTTQTPQTEETAPTSEQTTDQPKDETNTGSDPSAIEGATKIKLVFSDEVWLRIRDKDKKTVFEALNLPNTEKELTFSPPINLKVGNARGLKIYINGKEKDIKEHTKGNVARFNIE